MTDSATTDELVGELIDDRYSLKALIGRGGMAVVYRAWDQALERSVAIKILRDGAESDDDAHRRIREGRALAALYLARDLLTQRGFFQP